MKKIKFIFPAFIALFLTQISNAQDTNTDSHTLNIDIPAIAILDIEGGTSIDMDFIDVDPLEAGLDLLDSPSDNDELWLNYTSIVAASLLNKVQVKISPVVTGIDIKVTAAAASGAASAGALGTVASEVTLTGTDQDIVTSIGSCYTGNGTNNGHNLTYTVAPTSGSYASIVADNFAVTVTYTIIGQ